MGIVERHIKITKEMLMGMAHEEEEDLDPYLLVQCATEAENTRGIYNGHEIVGGKSLPGLSNASVHRTREMS